MGVGLAERFRDNPRDAVTGEEHAAKQPGESTAQPQKRVSSNLGRDNSAETLRLGGIFVQFCPVSKQGYSIRTTEHGVTVKFLF